MASYPAFPIREQQRKVFSMPADARPVRRRASELSVHRAVNASNNAIRPDDEGDTLRQTIAPQNPILLDGLFRRIRKQGEVEPFAISEIPVRGDAVGADAEDDDVAVSEVRNL